MIVENRDNLSPKVDVFNRGDYGFARRLVRSLGPVRTYGEVRSAFASQTGDLVTEMRYEALENIMRQAARLEGDAVFLERPQTTEGLVTANIRWDGIAVGYKPGISAERVKRAIERGRIARERRTTR